jgi:hypothetical protein
MARGGKSTIVGGKYVDGFYVDFADRSDGARVITLMMKAGADTSMYVISTPDDATEIAAALTKAAADLRLLIKAAT